MRSVSFRTALLVRFAFIALVPLLLLGTFAGVRISEVYQMSQQAENDLLVGNLKYHVQSLLDAPVVALRQFDGLDLQSPEARVLLDSSVSNVEYVESILLVGSDARVVQASFDRRVHAFAHDYVGLDKSADPQVIEALGRKGVSWSSVMTSAASGNRVIQVAVPLSRGAALATIDIESLVEPVDDTSTDSGVTRAILGRTGTVLFHSSPEISRLRPNLANLPVVEDARDGNTSSRRYRSGSSEVMGNAQLLEGVGWVVLVERDWTESRATISTLWSILAAALLAVAAVAAIVSVLFARQLHKPIARLGQTAGEIAQGDYSQHVQWYPQREMNELSAGFSKMAEAVQSRELQLARSASELEEGNERLEQMVHGITEAMGKAVEAKDPYAHSHQTRVAKLAGALASRLGLSEEQRECIELASLVHDVGKLGVPAEILVKPGTLSDIEMAIARAHSEYGFEILKDVSFPYPVADVVLQHHERMDGSGYPRGLVGDEISIEARVIAIADVVEAMASHRPYRPSLGLAAAIGEIRNHPQRFDPHVSKALFDLYDEGEIPF